MVFHFWQLIGEVDTSIILHTQCSGLPRESHFYLGISIYMNTCSTFASTCYVHQKIILFLLLLHQRNSLEIKTKKDLSVVIFKLALISL